MELNDKILQWFITGETGISSEAIACKMSGMNNDRTYTHPLDPDDFKRCLKLVNRIPEIRTRLDEMRSVSPYWNALIEHWKEVEDSFMSEVPEWLTGHEYHKKATQTYALMEKIYNKVRSK